MSPLQREGSHPDKQLCMWAGSALNHTCGVLGDLGMGSGAEKRNAYY